MCLNIYKHGEGKIKFHLHYKFKGLPLHGCVRVDLNCQLGIHNLHSPEIHLTYSREQQHNLSIKQKSWVQIHYYCPCSPWVYRQPFCLFIYTTASLCPFTTTSFPFHILTLVTTVYSLYLPSLKRLKFKIKTHKSF